MGGDVLALDNLSGEIPTQDHGALEPGHLVKRLHPRYPVAVPVAFEFDHRIYNVTSVNISKGGMFIETDEEIDAQQSLGFRIWLGGERGEETESLELSGTVVHLQHGFGLGIRFNRVDEYVDEMKRLERYLATVAKVE